MDTTAPKALIAGPVIPYSPELARAIGALTSPMVGHAAACILQQLHHFELSQFCAGRRDGNGLKWIYNTAAQWAAEIGCKEVHATKALEFLKNHALVFCERLAARDWNQTPHWRVNKTGLRVFLAQIGLKLSEDACPENQTIKGAKNQASNAEKSASLKQRPLQKHHSKNKQEAAPVAAFSAEAGLKSLGLSPAEIEAALQDAETTPDFIPPVPPAPLPQIQQALVALGVSNHGAAALVEEFTPEQIQQQIDWLPLRPGGTEDGAAGLLIASIKRAYGPPKAVKQEQDKLAAQALKAEISSKVHGFLEQVRATGAVINSRGQRLIVDAVDAMGLSVHPENDPRDVRQCPVEQAIQRGWVAA